MSVYVCFSFFCLTLHVYRCVYEVVINERDECMWERQWSLGIFIMTMHRNRSMRRRRKKRNIWPWCPSIENEVIREDIIYNQCKDLFGAYKIHYPNRYFLFFVDILLMFHSHFFHLHYYVYEKGINLNKKKSTTDYSFTNLLYAKIFVAVYLMTKNHSDYFS